MLNACIEIRHGLIITAVAMALCGVRSAKAVVAFDWATVGNAGNAADTLVMDKGVTADMTTGYGAVDYDFQIAKQHVTNAQYNEFLNAVDPNGSAVGDPNGIFNSNMVVSTIGGDTGTAYTGGLDFNPGAPAGSKYSVKSGQENYPAIWINWDSGARFVNWLHNGQGSGDTENGVYDMSITTDAPPPRQAGATYFIPSEDEFYKAAYYDPTKDGTGGYWQYGIQSDSPPVSEAPAGGATSANYAQSAGGPGSSGDIYWQNGSTFDDSIDYRTEVGAYNNATSYYGLFDVDGLVYQYTEGIKVHSSGIEFPAYRGGAWHDSSERNGAAFRALYSFRDAAAYAWYGLRIATVAEPVSNLPGDANGDGKVDLLDLDILGTNFGLTPAEFSDGDFNGDGIVDLLDLDILGGNFGAMATTSSAVPEPTAAMLAMLAVGILARRRGEK